MDRSVVDAPGSLAAPSRSMPFSGLAPLKPLGAPVGGPGGGAGLRPQAPMHQTGLNPALLAVRLTPALHCSQSACVATAPTRGSS